MGKKVLVVAVTIIIILAAFNIPGVAATPALAADACPEGTSQIPGWALGLCGDETLLQMAAGHPQGEIKGPGSGVFVILSDYVAEHCYGSEAAFWPLDPGVFGSIPVPLDQKVNVAISGRWGLGGATACPTPTFAVFLPLVLKGEGALATCPEGTSQIPGWAPGLCGNEAFQQIAEGQSQGEVVGPGGGVFVIMSEYEAEHCYGDEATFWPLTPGVVGSIPVPRDQLVTVTFSAGHWGLGGATECTP